MWMGVFNGFAGLKFSGSPMSKGNINEIVIKKISINIALKESFEEKKGWKDILSMFLFIPIGFLDPDICKDIRWRIKIAKIKNGIKKCSIKNRFSVAFLTEKPPHNHSTISFPIYGIADTRLVMTVAPQNDICPQGSTYPIKAAPINLSRIKTPLNHT